MPEIDVSFNSITRFIKKYVLMIVLVTSLVGLSTVLYKHVLVDVFPSILNRHALELYLDPVSLPKEVNVLLDQDLPHQLKHYFLNKDSISKLDHQLANANDFDLSRIKVYTDIHKRRWVSVVFSFYDKAMLQQVSDAILMNAEVEIGTPLLQSIQSVKSEVREQIISLADQYNLDTSDEHLRSVLDVIVENTYLFSGFETQDSYPWTIIRSEMRYSQEYTDINPVVNTIAGFILALTIGLLCEIRKSMKTGDFDV